MIEVIERNAGTLKTELHEAGFTTAAVTVDRKREIARKMGIACEHYRVVTPMNLNRFLSTLKRKTLRVWWQGRYRKSSYETLKFIPISNYEGIPPAHVIRALKEAREHKCFDGFQIAILAKKEDSTYVAPPDPILFGTIDGCPNKYCIAQWDDDVAIEDILKRGEG